jgi:hypothetical protein
MVEVYIIQRFVQPDQCMDDLRWPSENGGLPMAMPLCLTSGFLEQGSPLCFATFRSSKGPTVLKTLCHSTLLVG